jgi:hypothetical protein
MANTTRPNGFKPVKHQTGAPYNGQVNLYAVATDEGTAIFVGDLVKINGGGLGNYATISRGAANNVMVGCVVGVIPKGMDPAYGKMSGGSMTLDTPANMFVPATDGTVRYVLVCDDPEIIMEAQADDDTSTIVATQLMANFNVVATAGTTTTGVSNMQVDSNTGATTNTLPLQLVGFPNRIDNEVGATNQKVLVKFNTHQYKATTGVTGTA